ncbi:MAG: tRNA (guanosine(46)-N7)-methyltransferase TrmB [Bacteroidales bacterium]|nr:tRNA (guanosine(46)-N7)-methyltransferase TrmB [Bacteroidales bacterium]
MSRSKLEKFAENRTFPNFFQWEWEGFSPEAHFPMRGHWHELFFRNDHPIVLELACGRGEYTVGMAERDPQRNFMGVDRKGARMWKGCKYSVVNNMPNVAFLRTQIQYLPCYFAEGEVQEIWITFPDPQPRNCKENKRLTSEYHLSVYKRVLAPDGTVHLKTDSDFFLDFTLETLQRLQLPVLCLQRDIYRNGMPDSRLEIKTYYESMWLEQGKAIHYLKFAL